MTKWPVKNDYIDFHSHHKEDEAGIYRIYNQFISNQENTVYPGIHSLGLHPWHIDAYKFKEKLQSIFEKHLLNESAILVGESGLDKNISSSMEEQQEIFSLHIQASENHSRPLLIHCVKAYQELLAMKKVCKPKQAWIIHGFNGSSQLAGDLSDKGFSFSIGHSLIANPEKLSKVLKQIPRTKIFFETDESDYSIQELYAKAAVYLQLDVEDLRNVVLANFFELFKNDE
ncbi:MAG: TatD family hydrolase [Bacteroidales bacterium]|nr:TatD family hydrolase [Bacteroidales bacterium]MCF8392132.1 TatD family hydrolase [Bacteroidales bacterium]